MSEKLKHIVLSPELQAFSDQIADVVNKHRGHMTPPQAVAILAVLIGKCVACANEHQFPGGDAQIEGLILSNVQFGNETMAKQLDEGGGSLLHLKPEGNC